MCLLHNAAIIHSITLGNPGPSWHVKGTGDFNGDGQSDILLQNDNGAPAIWEVNDGSIVGAATLSNPGPGWHAIGSDDMLFISGTTGNATLAATPAVADTFVFTSFAAGAHAISGFDPARDLIEFSRASFANFTAVQAASTTSAGGTVIALHGGSTLTIQGVLPGALTSSDFKFV